MPRRSEIPEGIRSRVVDLHRAGKGYKVISKSLDIHHSTVRQIIYKWRRFNTVATLPRSGRPSKKTSKTQQAKLSETSDAPAGPPDDGGGDLGHEMQNFNTVPDAAMNAGSSSSDAEASDEDHLANHVPAGPATIKEESDLETSYNIVYIGENADASSSETDEDPVVGYLSGKPAEQAGGEPDHETHRGRSCFTPSDDETTENPSEQFFDSNFDEEKKIFAGSSVTVGALLLLLLTFVLKHDLSKAATKDLLDLLNFVVPGCVPKSLQFLQRHVTDHSNQAEIHFYCPKCTNYLGVEPGNECGVCQQRLSKKGLLEKAYYFLVMPLEIQLRNILSRVHAKLGKHPTKNASISDINTGSAYKQDRQDNGITLTFKCDCSPLLNTSKFSVWSILCTINELPYVGRCKNVLLQTLWFGRGKPQAQSFLTPFIHELHKLSDEGFAWTDETGSEHQTQVKAKICVCDSLTRSAMQNFHPFSREFGCGFCYHKGEMVQKGRGYTRVYPIQADGCDLRHMTETEQLAELVVKNNYEQGQMGVKGPSPLLLLPSFDIIKGFIPDYMHCFCLGVVPELVNLWFNPLYSSKPFHLTPKHLNELDKALCAIQPPNEIRQSPKRLSERMHWKASDWRSFALLYSPVILKNVLSVLYYKHWMLLICAFHVLLSQFATQDELSCAELCLVEFVAQVPLLYGLEHCSFNFHLLTHLTESSRDWGLLWANSSFVFEDMNSKILQMYSCTESVSSHVFTQFFSYEEMIQKGNAFFQNASSEMKYFFCSLTGCDNVTKPSNHTGEHVTLGCGSERSLTEREIAALQSKDAQCLQSQGLQSQSLQSQGLQSQSMQTRGLQSQSMQTRGLQSQSMQTRGLQSQGLQSHSLQSQGLQSQGLQSQGLQNQDLQSQSLQTQSLQSRALQSQSLQSQGLQSPGLQSHSLQSQGLQSQGLQSQSLQSQGLQSHSLQSQGLQSQSLQSQSLQSQSLQSQGLQSQGLQSHSLQSQGLQNQGLQSQSLQSQDLQSQGLKTQDKVTAHKSFVYKDMFITTWDYSIACKRNNSAIETTSGFAIVESVVVIPKPCCCREASSCSCREIVIFCKKLLRANSQAALHDSQTNTNIARFLVRVRSSAELCAVTCADIVAKCFMIEQEGRLYVMKMPIF